MHLTRGYLLDTNIISAVLKQDQRLIQKLGLLISQDINIYISAISYFEVKRGLLAVKAAKKLLLFQEMCAEYEILAFEGPLLLDQASILYANLRNQGQVIADNDIMIAATALIHNLVLVTHDKHFDRIPHLILENWLAEEI